jgi:hypothetical protein
LSDLCLTLGGAGVDTVGQLLTGFIAPLAGLGKRYGGIDAQNQRLLLTRVAVVHAPILARAGDV